MLSISMPVKYETVRSFLTELWFARPLYCKEKERELVFA